MKKKEALIYPYDLSNIYLLEHQNLLADINIKFAVSPRGWGYHSLDAGERLGVVTNIIVTSDFANTLNVVDTVIITESIFELPEEDILLIIEQALMADKDVIVLRSIGESAQLEEMQSDYNKLKRYKNKMITELNLDQIPLHYKLKDAAVPIVLILGTGERCNKFDIQLETRNMFLELGYKITQIGSKSFCEFFGFHSFPNFMLEDGMSTTNKIINFNRYINYLYNKEESDLIIIGVPGGITPYDETYHNDFGMINYLVSNGIKPDYTILSSFQVDFQHQFLEELKHSLKYKYQYDIDCIFLSNIGINWIETKSSQNLTYITYETSQLLKILKENPGCYNILINEKREAFKKDILQTLVGYSSLEAL